MAGRQVMVLAVVVAVAVAGVMGDCTHNDHCEPSSCCLLGFTRYSIPSCSPRGVVGSHCRVGDDVSFSKILSYPRGFTIELEEGHGGMCPCQSGLVCFRGKCQTSTSNNDSNSLSTEY